jgi:hypothetical protein
MTEYVLRLDQGCGPVTCTWITPAIPPGPRKPRKVAPPMFRSARVATPREYLTAEGFRSLKDAMWRDRCEAALRLDMRAVREIENDARALVLGSLEMGWENE